jgi:Tol biopolymer transport system component
VRLTTNTALDAFPAWSPDGSKIAFHSGRDGTSEEIYVMDSDGSDQMRLTRDPARDRGAAWSPDGTKITFTSNRGKRGRGTSDIWVMDADGTKPLRLTVSPDTDVDSDWQPLTDATTVLAAKPSQSPLERQIERIAARALSIRKLKNGATLYILPGGREVEQAAGKTPYVVKAGQQ